MIFSLSCQKGSWIEDFRKLNYRHPYYFWVTAKEGSISRVAGRIAMSYADRIFLLGERLNEELSEKDKNNWIRLVIGVSGSLLKMESCSCRNRCFGYLI